MFKASKGLFQPKKGQNDPQGQQKEETGGMDHEGASGEGVGENHPHHQGGEGYHKLVHEKSGHVHEMSHHEDGIHHSITHPDHGSHHMTHQPGQESKFVHDSEQAGPLDNEEDFQQPFAHLKGKL